MAELLREQCGVVSCRQLQELGLTRAAWRWRTQRQWRMVLPGVVCCWQGALSTRQQLIAAQLFAGEPAVITSLAAASWHGVLAAAHQPRVHVLVPAQRASRTAGFVQVRRTLRMDERAWRRGPLVIASPARAVADAARDAAALDQARAIVIEAVQRRVVRVQDVRHELESGPRRGSRLLRVAVQEAEAGAWSPPEGDLLRILATSRVLPEVWPNPWLTAADGTLLPRPDAWIDSVGMAIQVHSRLYHEGELDWDRTVMADGLLTEYGVIVLALTPARISGTPDMVLGRVERSYLAARERPRPAVIARRSGHGLVVA